MWDEMGVEDVRCAFVGCGCGCGCEESVSVWGVADAKDVGCVGCEVCQVCGVEGCVVRRA